MDSPDLILISVVAFTSVFTLLTILAIIFWAITRMFPEKAIDKGHDPAVIAAISTTYNTLFPGTEITKIEEQK